MDEAKNEQQEYTRPWPLAWRMGEIDGPKYAAMIADREASIEFDVAWNEEGWPTETSNVVRDVVFSHGELSGSTRLVEGPGDLVAEIYFGDDVPRVVATYQGRLPQGFYKGF